MDFTLTQKEYLNQITQNISAEFLRQVGALSEDFQHRLSASREPFVGISERMRRLEEVTTEVTYDVREVRGLLEGSIRKHVVLVRQVEVLKKKA